MRIYQITFSGYDGGDYTIKKVYNDANIAIDTYYAMIDYPSVVMVSLHIADFVDGELKPIELLLYYEVPELDFDEVGGLEPDESGITKVGRITLDEDEELDDFIY